MIDILINLAIYLTLASGALGVLSLTRLRHARSFHHTHGTCHHATSASLALVTITTLNILAFIALASWLLIVHRRHLKTRPKTHRLMPPVSEYLLHRRHQPARAFASRW